MEQYSGLLTMDGNPIPLRAVAIHVAAWGPASRVTVAQSYRNDERNPIEAVYTFPLPDDCAVCGFQVELGGQILKGQVEDRERCLEDYDSALDRGSMAFLMDQDRPNVFTAYVGNLQPQQEAVLRISYVAPLHWLPDGLQLIVPTVVSPRYFTEEQVRTMDPAELIHLTPPAVIGPLPYGFTLTLDLEIPGTLSGVECPSHPLCWEIKGNRLQGALAGPPASMDQDFVLNMKVDHAGTPFCLKAREADGGEVFMVILRPEILASPQREPLEVIFLVDCSGSMQGESASQARNAMDLCLRALEEGDTFNLVAFGSRYTSLFPEPRPYNQTSLEVASGFVQTLDGHMGGTEILPPLRAIFKKPSAPGRSRQVIMLTDGEVANESEILSLAKMHRGNSRIYPVGLGRGPNAYLLRSLARISGGAAEFVHPQARLEPVMVRLLEKVAFSPEGSLNIEWGEELDFQVPTLLPPVHPGEFLLAFARFPGEGPSRVTVKTTIPKIGDRAWESTSMGMDTGDDWVLPVMMAREAIRELEDQCYSSRSPGAGDLIPLKERILSLSKKYGILSSLTSFLVVAEKRETMAQEIAMRRVPVALTRGWGGWDSPVLFQSMPDILCIRQAPDAMSGPPPFLRSPSTKYSLKDTAPSKSPDRREQAYRKLIQRQEAEGWWPLDGWLAQEAGESLEILESVAQKMGLLEKFARQAEATFNAQYLLKTKFKEWEAARHFYPGLAQEAEVTLERLESLIQQMRLPENLGNQVVATLAALYLLHTKFQEWETEWHLSAAKAERWLGGMKISLLPPRAPFHSWLNQVLP